MTLDQVQLAIDYMVALGASGAKKSKSPKTRDQAHTAPVSLSPQNRAGYTLFTR